jgi:hypothetical protein
MWTIVKRDELKAPTYSNGHLRFHISSSDKANRSADSLENQFTACVLCDENHEVLVKAIVEALLEIVNSSPSERVRPCDIQN